MGIFCNSCDVFLLFNLRWAQLNVSLVYWYIQYMMYLILNVMNVFLPEIILFLDKGFHHLYTRAVLEDHNLCFPIFLNLKKLKKIVYMQMCVNVTTWIRWTSTPWEAITPSAKEEKLMFSPTTTLNIIENSSIWFDIICYCWILLNIVQYNLILFVILF